MQNFQKSSELLEERESGTLVSQGTYQDEREAGSGYAASWNAARYRVMMAIQGIASWNAAGRL